jgi:hypothetical protein
MSLVIRVPLGRESESELGEVESLKTLTRSIHGYSTSLSFFVAAQTLVRGFQAPIPPA